MDIFKVVEKQEDFLQRLHINTRVKNVGKLAT